MQLSSTEAGILHCFDEHGMREEFAVQDHQVDARDVHVHDAPSAHIQVADFAVPHLAFWQPNKRPAGVNQRVGILAQQPVVCWLARECDGVAFGFGSVSPAVKNDEYERFGTRHKFAISSWLLAIGFFASEKTIHQGGTEKRGKRRIYRRTDEVSNSR